MAKLRTRRFVPTPEGVTLGEQPLTKEQIIDALAVYQKQNPAKYEAKKEALFKRYGLNIEEARVEEPSAEQEELKELKSKAKKSK